MIVLGLDVSLTSTGVARLDLESGHSRVRAIKTGARRGHARMEFILQEIAAELPGVDYAGVEGFAYLAKSGELEWIYALGHMVRQALYRRRIPFAVMPPENVKLYVTGDGSAGKLEVMREIQRSFPRIPIPGDDEADALSIATMVARRYAHPVDMHRPRFEHALEKCWWPDHELEPRRPPRAPRKKPRFKKSPLDS